MLSRIYDFGDMRAYGYGLLMFLGLFCAGVIVYHIFPPDPSLFEVSSIISLYPTANEIALEWEEDAQLISVNLRIRINSKVRVRLDHNVFRFQSPKILKSLYVYIPHKSQEFEVETREIDFYSEFAIPISMEDLNFDSEVALNNILGYAGEEFLEQHIIGGLPISLEFRRDYKTGTVVWSAWLEAVDANMLVSIDAENGGLIKKIRD